MDNCLAQDWKSLVLNEGLKNNLISEWVNLLNLGVIEHAYHKFISDHAGLLLANENCYLVVSKLKLGSDFETDFMTLTEGYSNGSKIELIVYSEKRKVHRFTEQKVQTWKNEKCRI